MQTHYDAIIIGAGPAGSTAAILLAQAGWSVALLEKQPFPRRKVCGECIAAPNLELLDALGVGEAFDQLAGPPLTQVALMSGSRTVVASLPPLAEGKHAWGRALGREHLDTLLLNRAKAVGATVLQPWFVRVIEGEPGNFSCIARPENTDEAITLSTPLIIAAHGSWELTPDERSQSRQPHEASDLFAFKANFSNTKLTPGLLPVMAFAGGYGGMVLGDHGISTLACCIRRDTLSACRLQMPHATAAACVEAYLEKSCGGVASALSDAKQEGAWLSVGPIRPGIRINKHSKHLLIGNAAGEAHPIIGEGMSMAMQSAWLLSEKLIAKRSELSSGNGYESLQQDYTRQWQQSFAPRIRLAAVFAHAAMRPWLANTVLPILQRWPELLTHGARLSGKVKSTVTLENYNPAR
ncbi:MAG TPA: NAD(P)/FAD-dependent oxidoreductase [Methylophilaceae bacterium]|jgi:2-polyprenyl-6-methoxyphenol hydroxylase-like FAD-dependent oxidoreductase